MKRLAIAIFVLVAVPALAQSAADQQRLIAAIEANGCVITEKNNRAILRAAGMNEAEGREAVFALFGAGKLKPQGDDMKLVTGKCS